MYDKSNGSTVKRNCKQFTPIVGIRRRIVSLLMLGSLPLLLGATCGLETCDIFNCDTLPFIEELLAPDEHTENGHDDEDGQMDMDMEDGEEHVDDDAHDDEEGEQMSDDEEMHDDDEEQMHDDHDSGVKVAGFFGADWKVDSGDFVYP